MRYTPDFSSRFRILKGGKISLVVSALLVGSTILSADQTISAPQTSAVTTSTPGENVTVSSAGAVNIVSTGSGSFGVYVDAIPLTGTITNSGTIAVVDHLSDYYNSSAGIALATAGTTSTGAIINNGTISVTADAGALAFGIFLPYGGDGDGLTITNGAAGHLSVDTSGYAGLSQGIYAAGSYQNGSISNAGDIQVISDLQSLGIKVREITTDFSITNSGTITVSSNAAIPYSNLGEQYVGASAIGIYVENMKQNSSITNSGTIAVSTIGFGPAFGIQARYMDNDAAILNDTGGSITVTSARDNAIGIDSAFLYGNVSITNHGDIIATSNALSENQTWAAGINVGGMLDYTTNYAKIINTGNIVATSNYGADGIFVGNLYFHSSISNSGTITSTVAASGGVAYGIEVDNMYYHANITNESAGTITVTSDDRAFGIGIGNMYDTSSITNHGSISVSSNTGNAYGIFSEYVYDAPTITNTGTISVNSTSGHSYGIKAYIEGSSDSLTITNSGTITAHVNGVMDQNGFSMYVGGNSASSIINNDPSGKLYGNIFVYGTVNNNGLISLPYNANLDSSTYPYIANFNQSATGTLEIGLMSGEDGVPHYSQLNADTAHFASGSTIAVNVLTASANQSLLVGQTLNDVVSTPTGQLTLDGALNITDNSALLNFSYLVNGVGDAEGDSTIDLVVEQGQTVADSARLGGGGGADSSAAETIDRIKDLPGMAPVIAALNNCETNECVARAVASTTPQTHVSTQVAGTQIMNNVQGIVELRQNSTLGGGMNSGDKGLSEQNLWVKPFVSTGNQDNKDGINGFGFKMRGMGIGYDAEYAPNQRAGVALFVTDADVDVNNMNQRSDVRVYNILAYGNVPLDATNNFLYQAGYAWQKNEGQRYIGLVNQTAHSDYTSQAATIDLKLMQTHKLDDRLTIHPLAEATYRRFMMPSYDETGAGVLNLHVDDATSNHYLLGGGMITDYKLDSKSYVMVDLNLMYDFNHGVETVTAAYEGAAGVKFTSNGIDNGPWVYNAGVGYTMKTNENSELNFMYNYQGQGNSFDVHTLSAKYVWKF